MSKVTQEKQEGGGFENPHLEAIFAYISSKERASIPDEDFGWPEKKKFPVKDQEHLDSAADLLGRAPQDKRAYIKARLIGIAKRKGLRLPDSWEA